MEIEELDDAVESRVVIDVDTSWRENLSAQCAWASGIYKCNERYNVIPMVDLNT